VPQLVLDNMKLGQRADGGLREDSLSSLRRLVNYRLTYGGPTVDLEVRPGYIRWNAVEFSQPAKQVRVFVDQLGNQHILINIKDLWYEANAVGAHTMISSFAATPQQLYSQWGNRAFLGTDGTDSDDPGIVWVSDATIIGSPHAHRLGIVAPDDPPNLELHDKEGNIQNATSTIPLRAGFEKLAFQYRPTLDQTVREVLVMCLKGTVILTRSGAFRFKIYTDNNGQPSNTLVDENAVSQWRAISTLSIVADSGYSNFYFRDFIELVGNERVWFVIEADEAYWDNVVYGGPPQNEWWGGIQVSNLAVKYGATSYYNLAADAWASSVAGEAVWYFGNLGGGSALWYDYIYTYYNSTHQIESRPSEKYRIQPTDTLGVFIKGKSASDQQVDKIRIYRREVPEEESPEADITDLYHFVAEVDEGNGTNDTTSTAYLGAVLQTLDHYSLDEFSPDSEDGERTEAINPVCSCMWKGRLWVGEGTNSVLKYSKVFEEDGATGPIGASSPDYFPLDNRMEIPEPGYPISVHPVSNDQLVVHMSNDTTYMIQGGDQSLNPPADFAIIPFLHNNSSMGIWTGTLWSHFHVFLSKAGLYRTSGMGVGVPEWLSEENQSILDVMTNESLAICRIVPLGNEVWALLDLDNDGVLDTVLIADMERRIATREGVDNVFKMYQYDVGLGDMDSISAGDELQTMYAVDAENGFVLKLNDGTLDHETAITAYIDSHDLPGDNQAMINQIDIDVYMADLTARPAYTWLLTDHNGDTANGTLTPTANDDTRGARSGTRLKGATSVRARISQVSTKADKLRSVVITLGTE